MRLLAWSGGDGPDGTLVAFLWHDGHGCVERRVVLVACPWVVFPRDRIHVTIGLTGDASATNLRLHVLGQASMGVRAAWFQYRLLIEIILLRLREEENVFVGLGASVFH